MLILGILLAFLLARLRPRSGDPAVAVAVDDAGGVATEPGVETGPRGAKDKPSSSDPDGDGAALPPTVQAQRLIARLSSVRLVEGKATEDAVNAFRGDLLRLESLDVAALPAMEEFFDRREDVRYDTGPGTNIVGIPSLRIALMQLLLDISAPANEEFQGRLLTKVADPEEVVLLTRQLEIAVPGQFRNEIVDAAKASLQMIQEGRFPGRDPASLLKILERFPVVEPPPEAPEVPEEN